MSKVAVIKCENYDLEEVKNSIKRAIDLIGGIDLFVKESDKVLLKPNLLAAESADRSVTTHPTVFEAVVSILREKNVNDISYGDSPGIGKGNTVALKAGIDEAANKLNVKYADFEEPVGVSYEDGVQEKSFTIAKPIQEADVIISLPKLKSHALTTMTGAVKNQFGCIPGFRKAEYHLKLPDFEDFSTMLLDLNKLVNPKLYIMDGILAMEGNGPRNGSPRKINAIIVSDNAVALDYVASQIISFDYNTIPTLKMGFKHNFCNKYEPKPVIDKNKCVKCGVCVKVCPVTPLALNFDKKGKNYPPEYYYKNCISCYCCQELCPHKAIVLKRKF